MKIRIADLAAVLLFTLSFLPTLFNTTASARDYIEPLLPYAVSPAVPPPIIFEVSSLSVDSNYPSLGELGNDLNITLGGSGFTQNTRLTLMPDSGNVVNVAGLYTTDEAFEMMAVDLVGTVAYVVGGGPNHAINSGKLYILDITNPTEPSLLGTSDLPGFGRDVVVKGSYAYVTYGKESTSEGGFCVIDVSNPASSQLKDSVPLDVAYGIDVVDDIAYVVDGNCDEIYSPTYIPARGGLHAIDVSTPTSLAEKWSLDSFDTCGRGIKVQDARAYVANGWWGVSIVDIDQGSSTFKQTLNTPVFLEVDARDIDVVNSHAFIAGSTHGLWIYNVSDPSSVTLASKVDTPGSSRNVHVVGNVVYVADLLSGLAIFDISDPSAPTRLGSVDTDNASRDVMVLGGLAYVPDGEGGLNIIDVSNPRPPALIGSLESNSDAREVILDGSVLYMAQDNGVRVVDVSDPSAPKQTSLIEFGEGGGSAFGIAKDGSEIYAAAYNQDLRIVDLNTKGNTLIDLIDAEGYTWSAAVNSDFIFIGDGDLEGGTTGGLNLVDRIDSTQYRVELGGAVTDIVVIGQYAYVTVKDSGDDGGYNDNGLKIINVNSDSADFLNPAKIATVNIDLTSHPTPLGLAVDGNYAYVASDWLGVTIFNITDPSAPQKVGNSGRLPGGVAKSVKVSGNIAYVANSNSGVYLLDVEDKANPVIIGYVDTPGFANDIVVDGPLAHVADNGAGLTTVELPVEITPSAIDPGGTWITATLHSRQSAGHYTIRVFDNSQSDELLGAVTYTDKIELLSSKAIVVAGGGDYAGNQIWEETKAYANYAYDNLIYQGYRHEDITYITDEPSPLARYGSLASYANVKAATKANLQDAIVTWAAQGGTSDLLIFMEDHGDTEEFILRGGTSLQVVTADDLDSWLDTLQATLPGKVILVYDACRSGSFIYRLTPPEGKIRLTLTSSSPDQTAYFLSSDHSFSSHFWSTFSGKTGNKAVMTEAFDRASANMASYQVSQLDANGNGLPNEEEDYTALEGHEGTIYALRRQYNYQNRSKPVIPIVSDDQAAAGATLMAKKVYDVDGDSISRVWAEIYAPDFNGDPGDETVTGSALPSILFSGPDGNKEYATTTAPTFPVHGTYIITYYAEDSSGIYSLPRTSLVTQAGGTTNIPADQYENDNSAGDAQVIVPNSPTPQNHSFHVSGDQDWVKFYGIKDQVYNIRALNPTIISDPVIDLYYEGWSLKQTSNTGGPGEEESIIGWTCPKDGMYYVRITNNSTHFGANVRYKLKVYNPIALSLPGFITGKITSGWSGVAGAVLRAGGGTAITLSDGSYIMYLMQGGYSVSVNCPSGYESTSFSATVSSGGSTSMNVDVNSIPRIVNLPPSFILTNEMYSYTPSVVEPDGDSYSFSISGKPGWANFDSMNGWLWGKPGIADEGSYGPITITVTDSAGASSSKVFTIVVERSPRSGLGLPGVYLLLLGK